MTVCLAGACASTVKPSSVTELPRAVHQIKIDRSPKEPRRLMTAEVYLRSYLEWFGGLTPLEVQARAQPRGLFNDWKDYLAALGLPDYKFDVPRAQQSNTLMLAAVARLGEALCIRSVERDLKGGKEALDARIIFAFEETPGAPTAAEFASRLDVLHRLFLGYPLRLAPSERAARYFKLYQQIVQGHAKPKAGLSPGQLGWAAICTALVQHPEVGLY